MRGARRFVALTLSIGLAVVAPLGVTTASAGAPKKPPAKVTVNDFYFAPTAVTIKKGGSVKWVWSATNTYPHDVHLKQGPANLKRKGTYSTKTTAVTGAHFQKTFETAGTYKYICTIHPDEMRMTITVKR
jgi:plastocyanin